MTKDIKALIAIYTVLILSGWLIGINHQLKQQQLQKLEVMKIAIENDRLNKEYILLLQESRDYLNEALDQKDSELEEFKDLYRIKKDLARH